MSDSKKLDLVVLILIEVVASAVSLILQFNFLSSTLAFLGVPVFYLGFRLRRRSQWRRIVTMAMIFGLWYGYLFAFLSNWNRTWAWLPKDLSWGWLWGVNPIEPLWIFLWVFFIILFYEHFVERDTGTGISRRVWWAIGTGGAVTLGIFYLSHAHPSALTWPYAYAVLAVLTLIPALLFLRRNPKIIPKLVLPGLFFIPLNLAYEITGLILHQWYFPGQYFALVPLPGSTGVPIEEFMLWIVLGSTIVISYYELYVDDGK